MKTIFLSIILFVGTTIISRGQNSSVDSLKQLLEKTPRDTNRVHLLLQIADMYAFSKPDTCLAYAEEALNIARNLQFTNGVFVALIASGEALRLLGDYPGALKMQFEAFELHRKMKSPANEVISLGLIGATFIDFREYRQALQYLLQANIISQQLPTTPMTLFTISNIGNAYNLLRIPDSALYYQKQAYEKIIGFVHPQLKTIILIRLGEIYEGIEKIDSALQFYQLGLLNSRMSNEKFSIVRVQKKIAAVYESFHQYDSSMYYAGRAFAEAKNTAQKLEILESGILLVKLHRIAKNTDSAFYYTDIVAALKDSLYGQQKFKQLQLLMLEEQQRQQNIIQDQERYRSKIKYTVLLSALGVLLLLGFMLFRNNRLKQKAKTRIEKAYAELKATQAQLIQSEKMASLGELTAGIAHEIQNPLNFVNNFSEVNTELVDELKEELKAGNKDEAISIADNIRENEQKINHHGKRADAIVKGMLQHSRSSSGVKEPTDINALANEYLRLAYHGFRAKDKDFNATMKTDFDASIGHVNIIPQEIGRVLLNLINNAFYAVGEKNEQQLDEYEPTVSISTSKLNGNVEIKVRDNGNGIPQKVLDKIFQPFFTTKPTGQGTGLGLSLSYDIVKAHGGELKVNTKEGEYAEFIAQLPVINN